MENRARKAEMFTENSHLSLSRTITHFWWWSYPSTYLPGNLEKWEGFSVKFTECLQISILQRCPKTSLTLLPGKFRFGQRFWELSYPKSKCSPLCLNRREIFCMIYRQYDRLLHRVRCSYFYSESSCGKCQIVHQRNGGLCSESYKLIVIINSFPVLKLCDRENCHEQTVNSSENHARKLQNHGR